MKAIVIPYVVRRAFLRKKVERLFKDRKNATFEQSQSLFRPDLILWTVLVHHLVEVLTSNPLPRSTIQPLLIGLNKGFHLCHQGEKHAELLPMSSGAKSDDHSMVEF